MIDASHKFKRMLDRAETGIRHKLTTENLLESEKDFYGEVWECLNALKFMVRFESNARVHELKTHEEYSSEVKQ